MERTEERLKDLEETLWGNGGGYKEGMVHDMKDLKEKHKQHIEQFIELKRKLAFWHGVAATVIVLSQIVIAVWLRSAI